MKTFSMSALLIAVLLAGCQTEPVKKSSPPLTVSQLVGIINDAWASHRAPINDQGLDLDVAKLSVETDVTKTTSSEFDLVVVTADASRAAKSTQSVEFDLKKPDAAHTKSRIGKQDMTDDLDHAITAATTAAHELLLNSNGKNLVLDSVAVTVGFDVTVSADGSATITLGPIKIGPKLTHETESTQTIEFDFKRKT